MRAALLALTLAALVACRTGVEPERRTPNGSLILPLAALVARLEDYRGQRVAFTARIESVAEGPQGVLLNVREGEARASLWIALGFGAALRRALGTGEASFEVEVRGPIETPLGAAAIEVVPLMVIQHGAPSLQ